MKADTKAAKVRSSIATTEGRNRGRKKTRQSAGVNLKRLYLN